MFNTKTNKNMKEEETEKLELKHVIPYVDKALYGLFFGEKDIVTEIDVEHNIISSLNHGNVLIKDFKPGLRPLSDLTKEIEHNGKKFIPIKRIEELTGINDEYFGWETEAITKWLTYDAMVLLFEWYFNVFDLPKNLWVDINSL